MAFTQSPCFRRYDRSYSKASDEGEVTGTTGKIGKVLVVDDDNDQRKLLGSILELRGYSVETAENGRDALMKMRRGERPCLVLLDLMMPIMDGWKFWKELVNDQTLAATPVVVVSGVAEFPAARSIGAVAHLRKPVDLTKLYDVLAEHC